MPNLIESLGTDYCNQRVTGAMFLHNGAAHTFDGVDYDPDAKNKISVFATRYTGTTEKVKTEKVRIPTDNFPNWGALNFPTLGYRQAAAGQVLVTISRINSISRGLNWRDVRTTPHDVSYSCQDLFGIDLEHFTTGPRLVMMVLKPEYTPLSVGLPAVLAGKIPAFALSADFAIAPAADADFLEILYRGRAVGGVDENGKISLTVPSITALWNITNKEKKQ
jgi:hypothetical protein